MEESELSVRRTLAEINVSRSSFYRWYKAYEGDGLEGLESLSRSVNCHWNRIPDSVRELAWHITDSREYFISESSVYRILKSHDLMTSPEFVVMSATVWHRPCLLSDNGPCYVPKELKSWLETNKMKHTRGAPYHPMTQGKIERYHRSMKNVVKLEHYYFPWELERAIDQWVEHYNHERLHESLNNVTPADVYLGRHPEILTEVPPLKRAP